MPTKASDWIGQKVGNDRYEIVKILGEGGMGSVYLANDLNLEDQVVIKIPRLILAGSEEFLERFAREARSLVTLNHPHVVRIRDVGSHDQIPFAVMQFLSGGSLADRRQSKPMNSQQVSDWLPKVAEALDFVHAQNYVHRDVKPENILFDEHGNVYVGDFGVAKALAAAQQEQGEALTGGGMVGTAEYIAPEAVMGQQVDGRADQYSLAVTIYELLAGRRPFNGPNSTSIAVKHTTEPPPPLQQLRPDLPPDVCQIVHRAMEKDPAARFESCSAFAKALLKAGAAKSTVQCPQCQQKLKVKPSAQGKRVKCPKCGGPVQVPKAQAAPVPSPAGESETMALGAPSVNTTTKQGRKHRPSQLPGFVKSKVGPSPVAGTPPVGGVPEDPILETGGIPAEPEANKNSQTILILVLLCGALPVLGAGLFFVGKFLTADSTTPTVAQANQADSAKAQNSGPPPQQNADLQQNVPRVAESTDTRLAAPPKAPSPLDDVAAKLDSASQPGKDNPNPASPEAPTQVAKRTPSDPMPPAAAPKAAQPKTTQPTRQKKTSPPTPPKTPKRMTPAEAQLLLDEHGPERAERQEKEDLAELRQELFGDVKTQKTSNVDLLDLAHPEFEPDAMFELMNKRAEDAPDAQKVRSKVSGMLRRGLGSGGISSNTSRYRVFVDTSARDAYMEAWENERDAYLKEIVAGMRQELEERFEGHSEQEKLIKAFNRVWDNEPEPRAVAWSRRYSADLRKFVGRWGKLIRSLAPGHIAAVKEREAEEEARWREIERKLAQADQILGRR